MEVVKFLAVFVTFTLLYGVRCNGKFQPLNDKVNVLYERFETFENKQEQRLLSLKTELKIEIRQNIRTALSEILRGDSLEDVVNTEVVGQMKRLKRAHRHMRRQLRKLMTSLGQVREVNRVYREALLKGELSSLELLTVQLSEFESQNSELRQKLREQNTSCTQVNDTSCKESDSVIECSKCLHSKVVTNILIEHDRKISELNDTLRTDWCQESKNTTNKEESTESSLTTVTTRPTTDPEEERSRILVAPRWSYLSHRFLELNIRSNSLDLYSDLSLKKVDSLVYVSKLNSILIGLDEPVKIISSKVDSSKIVTVKHNVGTLGMAADEEREIIFLTTYKPSNTISRMALRGENFSTVVSLSQFGSNPNAIAIQSATKMIYFCNHDRLLSVRYDGSGLTTLDTGSHMFAVTLDINNGLLYYSNWKSLMKMSLSSNTSSEVTEFSFTIWNLIYHKDVVYYISDSSPYGTLGAVDVGHNIVSYTHQTVNVSESNWFAICLIP